MPIAYDSVHLRLVEAVPEFGPTLAEHLEGWHKAIPQAGTFHEFMKRCRSGQEFNFEDGYE